ncbi:hypothetical protein Fmac_020211 [Flemingia macrophylla]|uniref:Uncharacterized protein n=1 Tax=Flemingia macrophylla TaxID=520843 RepID=A0ABD1LTD5_9FABA
MSRLAKMFVLPAFAPDCQNMASLMKSKQFVTLLIVLTLLVRSSEARIFSELSTMRKKVHTKLVLRELINIVQNDEWHQKRSMLGGRLERVSPAGPDPQHH